MNEGPDERGVALRKNWRKWSKGGRVRFIKTKGKSAEKISGLILRELENDGIQIGDCRGQAYDNAAVMATDRVCRSASPKSTQKLYLCHAQTIPWIWLVYMQLLCNSVTFLAHWTGYSRSFLHLYITGMIQVTSITIKRAMETRWSSRADA